MKTAIEKNSLSNLPRSVYISALILVNVFSSAPQVVLANQTLAASSKINVDNFECVSDSLWRGAAPSDAAISQLAQSGVRTIIDLRMNKIRCQHEKQAAQRLGLNYVHLPMGFKHPSRTNITEFLKIVSDPVNLPVYIHCHQGADRTGVLIGIYRILVENWTFDHTYKEMRAHHFKPWLFSMKKSVITVADNESVRQSLRAAVNEVKITVVDSSEI